MGCRPCVSPAAPHGTQGIVAIRPMGPHADALAAASRGRPRGWPAARLAPGARALSQGHLKDLSKHSTVLLVGNVLSRGVSFLLVPIMTGVLAAEEFAYWESLMLAATLVSMVSAHGVTAALMWTLKTGGNVADGELDEIQRRPVIAAAVGWALLASLVIVGGCIAFSEQLALATTERTQDTMVLALLLASQGLRIVTYPAEGVLKLRFQSLPIVFMSFGEFLVTGLGSVLALTVFDAGLEGMAWASFAGAALRLGLGFVYLPEMRSPRIDLSIAKGLVRYGFPLMPGAVATIVLSLADRRFFIAYGMEVEGGLYAYGDKWARMVEFLLITPLVGMWPAVFFNIAKEEDAQQQFARIASLFAAVGGALAFAITAMGPVITALFDTSANDEFAGAHGPIGVLTVGYVFFGLNEVARVGFQVSGRTRRTAICMVIAAVLNLALNAALIPHFGALGAAWATLLAYGTTVVASLALTRSVYPQRWELRGLLHVGLVYVGGAWVLGLFINESSPAGIAVRILACAAAPLVLIATGFLRPDEWSTLKAFVGGLPGRLRRK